MDRNAHRIPGAFEASYLRLLITDVSELDHADFPNRHALQFAIIDNLSRNVGAELTPDMLEERYAYKDLRPFIKALSCSVSKAVEGFVEDRIRNVFNFSGYTFGGCRHYCIPDEKEGEFFGQIVQHVHSWVHSLTTRM